VRTKKLKVRGGGKLAQPDLFHVSNQEAESTKVKVVSSRKEIVRHASSCRYLLWNGDVNRLFDNLDERPIFDLIVTSPPYNLGKEYEDRKAIEDYVDWQRGIIERSIGFLKPGGSICWQVGNYIDNGEVIPLDLLLHPIFASCGLKLRNRIIWRFGHGLHSKRRFSGRYEVVLWYTHGDEYVFDLDSVRIPSKYPGKRHYKGPKVGQYSSHPLGKNPEDVWDAEFDIWEIPNVKSNHIEKTGHPCQFPVGLIERLVLALTTENALVFDPFAGVGSAGVACAIHNRRFLGAEIASKYISIAKSRIEDAIRGEARYRPHDKPIYDHTTSKLSVREPD